MILLFMKILLDVCSYRTDDWSDCSKTCGVGRRTRVVRCMQVFEGNFTAAVSHKRCRGLRRPKTHERCTVQKCAEWVVDDEWEKVSENWFV